MFATDRENAVSSVSWWGSGGDADYVEASKLQNHDATITESLNHGTLKDAQILDWVNVIRNDISSAEATTRLGGLRLLIFEREHPVEMGFTMTYETFLTVERTFKLHPSTLTSFTSTQGTYSRFLTYNSSDHAKLEQIQFVLKAPQKREVANYGLSLSHDVASGITTALLYGKGVLIRQEASNYWPEVPTLLDSVRDASDEWSHALLLPSLFLVDHMRRTRTFCDYGSIYKETVGIEEQLGVTQVGRKIVGVDYTHPTFREKVFRSRVGRITRSKAEELVVRINSNSTRALFTSRGPQWNRSCSVFIMKLLDTLESNHKHPNSSAHHTLKELLEYNIVHAEALADHVAGIQNRMSLQLNVLFNIVAQQDNQVSAKLAVSSGRDSVSMKILAFISALFLPGSFVAGIFSTTMFNWQAGGDGSPDTSSVVSSRFWIYWATAIPLTVLTLLGWALWWTFEMERFKIAFAAVADRPDSRDEKRLQYETARRSPTSTDSDLEGDPGIGTTRPVQAQV